MPSLKSELTRLSVRQSVRLSVVLSVVLAFLGTALYGTTDVLWGFIAKPLLYKLSAASVLSVLALWLGWAFSRRRHYLADNWRSFLRADLVEKMLAVLLPGAIVATAIFMVSSVIAVAYRWAPQNLRQSEVFISSKVPINPIRNRVCPYKADVRIEDQFRLNQCLTKVQYETLQLGSNAVAVADTPIGYYIQ